MSMDPVVIRVIQAFFGVFFCAAAFHKVRFFAETVGIIEAYADQRIRRSLAKGTAAAVIFLEGVIAVLCLFAFDSVVLAAWIVSLLFFYGLVMAANLLAGRRDLDCGCSWAGDATVVDYRLIVRNGALIFLAGLLFLGESSRVLIWLDFFTVGFGAACLSLLYLFVEQSIRNSQLSGVTVR